jgi:hypothetical protein
MEYSAYGTDRHHHFTGALAGGSAIGELSSKAHSNGVRSIRGTSYCEKARGLPLPAGSGPHEPVKLLAGALPLLCGLLLESPE